MKNKDIFNLVEQKILTHMRGGIDFSEDTAKASENLQGK